MVVSADLDKDYMICGCLSYYELQTKHNELDITEWNNTWFVA